MESGCYGLEDGERSGEWKGRSLSAGKINYRGGFDGFVKRIGDDKVKFYFIRVSSILCKLHLYYVKILYRVIFNYSKSK